LDESVYDGFKGLYEKYLEFGIEHSVDFFKKQLSETVVQAYYNCAIKPNPFEEHEPSQYAPTVACKMDKNDNGVFNVKVFDGNNIVNGEYQEIVLTEDNYQEILPKGSQVQAILSFSGYVADKRFGLSIRIEQLKVFNTSNRLNGYSFEEELNDTEPQVTTTATTQQETNANAKQNDNENNEDEEVTVEINENMQEISLVDETVKKPRGRAAKK
jgi:hypothetical protein